MYVAATGMDGGDNVAATASFHQTYDSALYWFRSRFVLNKPLHRDVHNSITPMQVGLRRCPISASDWCDAADDSDVITLISSGSRHVTNNHVNNSFHDIIAGIDMTSRSVALCIYRRLFRFNFRLVINQSKRSFIGGWHKRVRDANLTDSVRTSNRTVKRHSRPNVGNALHRVSEITLGNLATTWSNLNLFANSYHYKQNEISNKSYIALFTIPYKKPRLPMKQVTLCL